MQRYTHGVQTVCAFIKKDFLTDTSYRLSFVTRWIGIGIAVFTFYYLSRLVNGSSNPHLLLYGGSYFAFVIVGLAAISYLDANVNGFVRTVLSEQRSGMLEIFLSTPAPQHMLLPSLSAYNTLMGLIAAACYLLCGRFVGVAFSSIDIGALCTILLLGGVSFLALGVIAASCVIIFKRGDPVTWIATHVCWLLGGVYFPVTVLPKSLQAVSLCIPSTYILHSLRLVLLRGYTLAMIRDSLVILAFFAGVLSIAGYAALTAALYYARKKGTITFY